MTGTAIVTKVGGNKLVEILRKKGNNGFSYTFTGRYIIHERGKVRNAKVLFFIPVSNPLAPKYLIFVVGGIIYANKIAGAITDILDAKNIPYKVKTVTHLPSHIKSYIKRHTR